MNKRYRLEAAKDASGIRIFDRYKPIVKSGEAFTVRAEQAVTEEVHKATVTHLKAKDALSVHFLVEGPHERLLEGDIVGRYPAAGTCTSPDEFLPHVALSRRTLPWERVGPAPDAPWIALLVFAEAEVAPVEPMAVKNVKARNKAFYTRLKKVGYAEDTSLDLLWVSKPLLTQVLPHKDELPLLCHIQQLVGPPPAEQSPPNAANAMFALDDDACVAIVVANRLPDAGPKGGPPRPHVACLVSLENRSDLFPKIPPARKELPLPAAPAASAKAVTAAPAAAVSAAAQPLATGVTTAAVAIKGPLVPMVVLHHWRFTPSTDEDFEEVVKAIRYTPNGGVLRFGRLPRKQGKIETLTGNGYLPLDHEAGQALYRGPLSPIPTKRGGGIALRADPSELDDPAHPGALDHSYAAAFEIGRLMAMADDGLLSDLQGFRCVVKVDIPGKVLAVDPRPPRLARKDWVVDSDPTRSIALPAGAKADPAGVAALVSTELAAVVQSLASQQAASPNQSIDPGQNQTIDIDAGAIRDLDAQFSQIAIRAQS